MVTFHMFALCPGANVKIGVPENYDGIFPWYLAKVRRFSSLEFSSVPLCLYSDKKLKYFDSQKKTENMYLHSENQFLHKWKCQRSMNNI